MWDLAGQPEYRLVNQLFLDDADAALLLFDCSDHTDPFHGVTFWIKALKKQARVDTIKLLVSARCDVCPVTASAAEIEGFISRHDLNDYVATSAMTGQGVATLWQKLVTALPWESMTRVSSPWLFRAVREVLLERKNNMIPTEGLVPVNEVEAEVRRHCEGKEVIATEVAAAVRLMQAQGLVYRLVQPRSRERILVRPEMINVYASSIVKAAREHWRGVGAVPELDVLSAAIPLDGVSRLQSPDEEIVLKATVELMLQHDLCFREMGMLIFPSQINVLRPAPQGVRSQTEVAYRFSGAIESIYASLVVRLSNTEFFRREDQWKDTSEFSRGAGRLGFHLHTVSEGTAELEIYFDAEVDESDRVTFTRFVTEHLQKKGIEMEEEPRLHCPRCGREVTDRAAVDLRVKQGMLDIICQWCDTRIIIPRGISQRVASQRAYQDTQKQLEVQAETQKARILDLFRAERPAQRPEPGPQIHLLHLSDLHLGTPADAQKYLGQLATDLTQELKVRRLEYLLISGDVATRSVPNEYEAALALVEGVVDRFGLDADRVVVVPGNHDLNWDLSAQAYRYVPKHQLPRELTEDYVAQGNLAVQRDETAYGQRFSHFSSGFYKRLYQGIEYPIDAAEQALTRFRPDDRLLFLTLNSCWQIDHLHPERSGICPQALSRALDRIMDERYKDWLKIAVWHHPVTGQEMMNDEFLQLLSVHNFQLCLHGHIHEAQQGFYKYDENRGLHIVGAGTFGAPVPDQTPGIPLQYNLLILDPEGRSLTVETRKKEKPDGAWTADARWQDRNNPLARYAIQLK